MAECLLVMTQDSSSVHLGLSPLLQFKDTGYNYLLTSMGILGGISAFKIETLTSGLVRMCSTLIL